MAEKKRLIIIDGNSLAHRAYHALPPLKTKKGELVQAVYGFLSIFLRALKDLNPDFVAATFDLPGPTLRHKEFKDYKAKRPKAPQELYEQISKIKQALFAFGVPIFEKEGFEADDLIGAIALQAPRQQVCPKLETIILSGDLDTLQLVNAETKVYTLKKGIKDTVLYDEKAVKERYGLTPEQILDFKGLKGDPSDNIPGVAGVGEKTAVSLVKQFATLENLYQELAENSVMAQKLKPALREKLKNSKEAAFFSRDLARIRYDALLDFKLEDCAFGNYDVKNTEKVLKDFEFYSLLKRLPKNTGSLSSLLGAAEPSTVEEIEKLLQQGVFSERIAELEKKLVAVVKKMEENGIKVDLLAFKQLSESLTSRLQKLASEIYQLAGGEFNLNSSQQLSEVLFSKLNLSSKGLRKTPGGVISTGAGELEKLKEAHSVIGLILQYRQIFKLKSGFVEPLPKMVNPRDGRLHPHFGQLGAETGRMVCSEPNLQNIPVKGDLGREIRKCFVPEPGFSFLSADYSQTELRIAASAAQDEKMLGFFKQGKDIHQMTASQIFGVAEEKVSGQMRKIAKAINFGVLYGMGARGVSQRTGVSFEEAQEFINHYFSKFKGIAEYVEKLVEEARRKGFSETLFGRKRFLPEINSIDRRLRASAERMARNFPVQGTAADIIKLAMVEINNQLLVANNNCRMLLQIHDELLFEVKDDRIKESAAKIKEIMENVVELKASLFVEIKAGKNWGELEAV